MKFWTVLGPTSRSQMTCEVGTKAGRRCRRKAYWRYGEDGHPADIVTCPTHKGTVR